MNLSRFKCLVFSSSSSSSSALLCHGTPYHSQGFCHVSVHLLNLSCHHTRSPTFRVLHHQFLTVVWHKECSNFSSPTNPNPYFFFSLSLLLTCLETALWKTRLLSNDLLYLGFLVNSVADCPSHDYAAYWPRLRDRQTASRWVDPGVISGFLICKFSSSKWTELNPWEITTYKYSSNHLWFF